MPIFGFTVSMAVVWLALALIFLVIEGISIGLTSIWFAAGAFVALLLSLFDAAIWLQIAVFLIVSICLLVFTRKIFVEKLKAGSEKTNVDALIGEEGLVIAEIQPFATGQVKVGGQIWTAVGQDTGMSIEKDTLIKVAAIEGVKLVVIPAE
ncbi:MAG: NfeD family protein [Firmicutes bacterium]|nr:NfeD family protein [Bacillota bacterium]